MSRYKIRNNGKHGFIDENGVEVIKPQFESVSDFNEDVAWAVTMKEKKWVSGFINESGDWIIEPKFSGYGWSEFDISFFSEGLAPIQSENKKMMFIDKQGKPITNAIYDTASPFSEGRALVSMNGLFGYIDNLGNEVIKCQYGVNTAYKSNSRFSQGLAAVRFSKGEEGIDCENNFGYIDINGNTIFEPEDYYANAFSEGFAMVKDNYDYYFINLEGEIPFERTTPLATSFSEGLAEMYDNETECVGFMDTKGEWVIQPQFEETLRFTEGLACVKRDGEDRECFINMKGETIISERFDTALPFKNGLAYAEEKGEKGYINKLGKFVWQSK